MHLISKQKVIFNLNADVGTSSCPIVGQSFHIEFFKYYSDTLVLLRLISGDDERRANFCQPNINIFTWRGNQNYL